MREAQSIAIVHNIPQEHDQYIVARCFDGELWFWGSWKDKEDAKNAARKVDGVVVEELSFKFAIVDSKEYGRRFEWNSQS